MPLSLDVQFTALDAAVQATTALLAGTDAKLGATAGAMDQRSGGTLTNAIKAAEFKGKLKATIEVLAPPKLDASRLIIAGAAGELEENDQVSLGGAIYAAITARKIKAASIVVDMAGASAEFAADIAYGALLRSYTWHRKSKKSDDDKSSGNGLQKLVIHCAKPTAAEAAFESRRGIAEGVALARDLVNEPPNELGPLQFADRIAQMSGSGLEIEILDEVRLRELKMGALLGVAQGSARPARVAIMTWNGLGASGSKSKRTKPVCFIGKGVTFDTGGISLKPGAGMEDMKGDMGGAACVTGLMLALAKRKANVNAVGLVGLVENMPSGTAQRPGDIVTSMSGQTIEIINTDAEGRLVLADVLWYAEDRFKPRFMIDLATLTGAIMVALGKENAGLFSNNDKLVSELRAAGHATGELVWHMPLSKAYDKLIDSRFADMKNTGGRHGGAITAAQFLQRFVRDVPWAHLDVAGTAMDSAKTDINTSWGSGWGVRLLDRLVAEHYEKG